MGSARQGAGSLREGHEKVGQPCALRCLRWVGAKRMGTELKCDVTLLISVELAQPECLSFGSDGAQ